MAFTDQQVVVVLRDTLKRNDITKKHIEAMGQAFHSHETWDEAWSDYDISGVSVEPDGTIAIELIFYAHQVAYETYRFEPELFDHPASFKWAVTCMKESQYPEEE